MFFWVKALATKWRQFSLKIRILSNSRQHQWRQPLSPVFPKFIKRAVERRNPVKRTPQFSAADVSWQPRAFEWGHWRWPLFFAFVLEFCVGAASTRVPHSCRFRPSGWSCFSGWKVSNPDHNVQSSLATHHGSGKSYSPNQTMLSVVYFDQRTGKSYESTW